MTRIAAPDSSNLLLGKGALYFDRFAPNTTTPTGMLHLGNITSLAATTEDDILTKYSSMSAGSPVLKRVNRRRTATIRISMDEFHPANLALALMGDLSTLVQAGTAVVGEAVYASTLKGAYFRTKKLGPISAVTVYFGATPGVLDTDYRIVDATLGLLQILPTTALTGAVTIDYTPTAYTSVDGPEVVGAGTQGVIEGKFMFVGDPASGPRMLAEIWRASIAPDGAVDFIGDDFAAMGLSGTVLDDTANHPSHPLWEVTYL